MPGYDFFKKRGHDRRRPLRLAQSRWRRLAARLHTSEGFFEGLVGFVDSGDTHRPAIRLVRIHIFFVGRRGRWGKIATDSSNDRRLK